MAKNELGSDPQFSGDFVEQTIPVPDDGPSNSQSPQALRHGSADPYYFEGEPDFGNVNDAEHENAGAWKFQGKGGDQMYDVRK